MSEISLAILDKYRNTIDYPNHTKADEKCRFLYLFRNPFSNLCKIGVTNNPRVRLSQIRNSSGMIIQPLITLQCEVDYDEHPLIIERFLHEHFASKRTHGEWFNLSIKDILAVRMLIWEIEGDNIWDNTRPYLSKKPREWEIEYTF